VLPFEEYHSVESARLQDCPSAFAYGDPETGAVRTVPVCLWGVYKNGIQRRIMESYAPDDAFTESNQSESRLSPAAGRPIEARTGSKSLPEH